MNYAQIQGMRAAAESLGFGKGPMVTSVRARSGFDVWMKLVERECAVAYGVSVLDLPDIAFADLYERGVTPKAAARKAYRNAGGE